MTSHDVFDLVGYGRGVGRVLLEQARLAGILRHKTSTGDARELFVRLFLRRFLPPAVAIGRGLIVTGTGRRSRQIDLLMYRPNFPVIDTFSEHSLFFAEGVLGSVEVKSRLTKKFLLDAFRNVASVRDCQPSAIGLAPPSRTAPVGGAPDQAFLPGSLDDQMPALDAALEAAESGMPDAEDPLLSQSAEYIRTYILAFTGPRSIGTLADWIREAESACPNGTPDCLCVIERAVALRRDPDAEHPFGLQRSPVETQTMIVEENPASFGLMLAHLWRGVLERRDRAPALRPYFRSG